MIYFISDTHFGHENIIKFCNRPFSCASEMDEILIKNWNNKVNNNDTVYILGDMFFRTNNAEEILTLLKGEKHLILGNHDKSCLKKINGERHFLSIQNYLVFSDGKRRLTLCHYPMLTWNHAQKSYMIHGHIHNDRDAPFWKYISETDNLLNAGVEVNNYQPVTFEELLENNRKFKNNLVGF